MADKTNAEGIETQKTQEVTPEENAAIWSAHILKTARVSKLTQEYRDNKDWKLNIFTAVYYEKNPDKNRYNDIPCMDENRVVLKERDATNDYIHASWMTMPDGFQYISTQGPLKNTIDDFWHMIYTEKCRVIIMLCQYVEDDAEKCRRYFDNDATKEYGEYKVSVKEKQIDENPSLKYTVLQLSRKGNEKSQTVHHYWYHDWHDHVAPLDPIRIIRMHKSAIENAKFGPITVHCSAGVGRTSTYIGIHYAVEQIKINPKTTMVDILKSLRKMRYGSIQSQLQYVFLHICVIQLLIVDGIIKREHSFDEFLKKYENITKKVMTAIDDELKKHKEKKSVRTKNKTKSWETKHDGQSALFKLVEQEAGSKKEKKPAKKVEAVSKKDKRTKKDDVRRSTRKTSKR
ncbi:unnamed protein product [Caenorhabditis bovis]|uniref:Protein-tyrosine-phosphatase n=1 Tax=Caenorhabditis bovis TaxID=2654633 RepID=A0A8S1EY35_9PELO|nr:unnamed protein product [Caenorhabditis bovis]